MKKDRIIPKSYDFVVVGGGLTGVCATIAAARQGVKTLLVEQSGFCGGMATMGLVGPFIPVMIRLVRR